MNIELNLSTKQIEIISRCIHLAILMGDESHQDRQLLVIMDRFFTEIENLSLDKVGKVS
jgi:hypothetical protein